MSEIKFKVVDQDLYLTNQPTIASHDVGVDQAIFSFEGDDWDGRVKTAVFFIDEDRPYYKLLDINGACTIPSEVMTDAGRISIGVFGVLGDTILTSAIIKYKIVPGAIIQVSEDVTPELWEQILQAYQSIAGPVSDLADTQTAFINNASQVIRQLEDALMTIQGEVSDMDGGVPSTSSYDTDIDAGGAGGD